MIINGCYLLITGNLEMSVSRGPIELLMGFGVGIIWGLLVGYIPHKCEVRNNNFFIRYYITYIIIFI